jgi:hypothetical protein
VHADRSAGSLPAQRVEPATHRLDPGRDVDRHMLACVLLCSAPQRRFDRALGGGAPRAVDGATAQALERRRHAL